MKIFILSTVFRFLLACMLIFGPVACDKQGNAVVTPSNLKLAPANVAKMQKGMTRTQVVALFGQPTTSGDVKEYPFFKKQTVTYVEGKQSLSVTYKNDEVEEYNSTVGATTSTTTSTADSDGQTSTTTSTSKSE